MWSKAQTQGRAKGHSQNERHSHSRLE